MEIVLFIILLLISIVLSCFLITIVKENKQIKKNYTRNKEELRKELYYKLIEEESEKVKNNISKNYEFYKKEKIRLLDSEIQNEKNHRTNELNSFANDIAKEWDILTDIKINSSIEKERVLNELNDLEQKREKLIAAAKREDELKNEREFHSIFLSIDDVNDIKYLEKLKTQIRRPSLLAKLIWSEYLLRPTKELTDRVVGKNKTSGIYKITYITNGKSYIGQSVDIATRITNHIKTALKIDGGCAHTKFHDYLHDLGIENFTFEILEECSKEKLNEREKYYINFYKTTDYGFNTTTGGS